MPPAAAVLESLISKFENYFRSLFCVFPRMFDFLISVLKSFCLTLFRDYLTLIRCDAFNGVAFAVSQETSIYLIRSIF